MSLETLLNTADADFDATWDGIKDQITLETLTHREKEGPLRYKSILWFLCFKAFQGNSEPFLYIWNKFKDEEISRTAFFLGQSPLLKNEDDISPFTLLLIAAGEQNQPKPYSKFWNKYHHELAQPARFYDKVKSGPYQGKSPLFFLAKAAALNGSLFFKKFMEMGKRVGVVDDSYGLSRRECDFFICAEVGEDAGRSPLWYLALGAARGNQEFLALWWRTTRFKSQKESIQQHNHGLGFILEAAAQYDLGMFTVIYNHFKESMLPETLSPKLLTMLARYIEEQNQPEHFRLVWLSRQDIPLASLTAAPAGVDPAQCALWYLAKAASKNRTKTFRAVWAQIHNLIPLEALLRKDVQSGKSILDFFLDMTETRNSLLEALSQVLARFNNEIDPILMGTSLWTLAKGAYNGRPDGFQRAWPAIKHRITLAEVLVGPDEGEDRRKSILWFALKARQKNFTAPKQADVTWCNEILALTKGPGEENMDDFQSLEIALQAIKLPPVLVAFNHQGGAAAPREGIQEKQVAGKPRVGA